MLNTSKSKRQCDCRRMRSPLGSVNSRLSSMTLFMFSTQTASTSPSKTKYLASSCTVNLNGEVKLHMWLHAVNVPRSQLGCTLQLPMYIQFVMSVVKLSTMLPWCSLQQCALVHEVSCLTLPAGSGLLISRKMLDSRPSVQSLVSVSKTPYSSATLRACAQVAITSFFSGVINIFSMHQAFLYGSGTSLWDGTPIKRTTDQEQLLVLCCVLNMCIHHTSSCRSLVN